MHIQNINDLINLQDINIVKISEVKDNIVYLTIEPTNKLQNCPYCNNTEHIIKKGNRGYLYRSILNKLILNSLYVM